MTESILGHIGVWIAFLGALGGSATSVVCALRQRGAKARSLPHQVDGRSLLPAILGGSVLAVVAMEVALVTHNFRLTYVADNNAKATPLLYSITGLWSSLAGSILLWSVILAIFCALFAWRTRTKRDDEVVRWAGVVLYAITAFFFGLMLGPADPFETVAGNLPLHGAGPNALLQDNPLVAIHPPLLYMGFVGFSVPFAFAIGMLVTGRVGEDWQAEMRRFTVFTWTMLSVGIVLGAWWSYQVLGWGGFWGWDPVENAALLPWLCGTAYLHSVLVQERRGLFRVWNMTLAIAGFALTILATFLTRSGVIVSVHAFSQSSLGPILIGAFIFVTALGMGLLAWRGDRMRSPGGIDAPLGREGAFLVNNVVFVGFAFVVLLGTLFPLLYQALKNQSVSVGAPYFDTIAAPAGLFLLFLMAIAPVLSWRKMSGSLLWSRISIPAGIGVVTVVVCVALSMRGVETLIGFGLAAMAAASAGRSLVLSTRAAHRRGVGAWRGLLGRANGGMIVHLGVVVMALALVAATSFRAQSELSLLPGRVVHYDGHRFEFLGRKVVDTPQRLATEVVIVVDGHGRFYPAISQYGGANSEAVGTPAIDSSLVDDVYLTWDATGRTGSSTGGQVITGLTKNAIALGVVIEPLMMWLWVGGLIVGIGGLASLWPGQRRRATDPISAESTIARGNGEDASTYSVFGAP